MKRFLSFASFAALLCAPFGAQAQTSGVVAGPHGYDWLVGTWTCVNKNPSPIAGPATSKLTVSRSTANAFFAHSTGANFDVASYLTYDAKTHTWWSPSALADGSYGAESSKGTGKSVVFAGSFYAATGAHKIRDTYTMAGPGKYTDVGDTQTGGAWKTLYTVTCTKS